MKKCTAIGEGLIQQGICYYFVIVGHVFDKCLKTDVFSNNADLKYQFLCCPFNQKSRNMIFYA